MPAPALSGLQLDVVRALWERGEATVQEITDAVEPPRALTTIATVLRRLDRQRVVAYRRDGRQYVYWALVSEAEVRRSSVGGVVEALFGGDPSALVAHLVGETERDGLNAETVKRLRVLVEAHDAKSLSADAPASDAPASDAPSPDA